MNTLSYYCDVRRAKQSCSTNCGLVFQISKVVVVAQTVKFQISYMESNYCNLDCKQETNLTSRHPIYFFYTIIFLQCALS